MGTSPSISPRKALRRGPSAPVKILIAVGICLAVFWISLLILRLAGLVYVFSIPTKAMTPAISAGDHVFAEGVSYLLRKPRRGDIIVFRTVLSPWTQREAYYDKRIVGLPGEHLLLADGRLFIDGKPVTLSNSAGPIHYIVPARLTNLQTNVTVPAGHYYVLGDNSTNSLDSRFVGSIKRADIKGAVVFCYWPPARWGIPK